MITLGELLNLVDNFYNENSLIKVFDVKKVAEENDCLAEDTIGCVFGICAGEATGFLTARYEKAEIVSIYIGDGQELRVLVDTHNEDEDEGDAQWELHEKRLERNVGASEDTRNG